MRVCIITLLILSVFSRISLKGDVPEWQKYHWEDSRKPYVLTSSEQKSGGVIIKDKRIFQIPYYTKHVIVSLNSDKAIEEYNKVYISMTGVDKLLDLHARFISKSGKITNLDLTSVKDVDNYENYGPYKIFALEGVEIGGEVEYIYTVQKTIQIFNTETYRSSLNYRTIILDIFSYDNLKFEAKSYNGLPPLQSIYGENETKTLHMEADSISGFEKEPYSLGDASYPRVEYMLTVNFGSSYMRKNPNTWKNAATDYDNYIAITSDKDDKMCRMLYKKMNINLLDDKIEKIRKIESYLKLHFTVKEDNEDVKYDDISEIVKTHLASDVGIMRLYHAVYDVAEVKQEIVLTTDRFNKQFDGDFQTWSYLQHFLLFFPETGQYIAPTEQFSRYGFVPPEWTSQDGLFISELKQKDIMIGTEQTYKYVGVGEIKHIDGNNWQQNTSNIYADITFEPEKRISNVHLNLSYTGYSADFIQPYFSYYGGGERFDEIKQLATNISPDAKPKNIHVTGFKSDDSLYYQPFSVSMDYLTSSFLEKTCDKYIFKIGEVIGPQYELYDENERNSDIDFAYPYGLHREITFEVPVGYRVTNLEALNMDVHHEDDTTRTMEFVSSYKQEGRKVKVTVNESYRQTHYPKAIYEDFRKVINASADFNKIVVYFEKESN